MHIRESRILALVRPRMQAAGLQCLELQIAVAFPDQQARKAAGLQCLKAPDCGRCSQPANPRISRRGAFPEDLVTEMTSAHDEAQLGTTHIQYIYIYIYVICVYMSYI